MKSSKVNTKYNNGSRVRNISAFIALMLAGVTLLQATNANSYEAAAEMTTLEANLLEETEMFMEAEFLSLEEALEVEIEEASAQVVSVFNADNELIMSGDPAQSNELRSLVNKADFLSELGKQKYYRISE